MQNNPYASVPEDMAVTAAAAAFIETVTFEDLPEEAIHLGTRCVLDGMGLFVSGADEPTVRILAGNTPHLLGHGDCRCKRGYGRVGQQSINMVGVVAHLAIVPVVGMSRRT